MEMAMPADLLSTRSAPRAPRDSVSRPVPSGALGWPPKCGWARPYSGSLQLLAKRRQQALQAVQRAHRGAAVFLADRLQQLVPLDQDGLGGFDAELHLVPTDFQDGDLDFRTDDDPFVDFSCEDEHRLLLARHLQAAAPPLHRAIPQDSVVDGVVRVGEQDLLC